MRDDPRQPPATRRKRLISWLLVFAITAVIGVRLRADDWPEWRGKGRLGVWNETGIIDKIPAAGLPVAWRTPVDEGYAGPSVSGGRVFVTDARRLKGNQRIERIRALDEATGRVLWGHEWQTDYSGLQLVYAIGPRATPTVDGDRVYVVGAMGNLFALETATGKILWQKDYAKDFNTSIPSWGVASAPLVDGDRLICIVGGEPDAKVIAFNKMTGDVMWKSMSSETEPGYNQPIIFEAGGVRQLIIFHPSGFASLDPVTGKVYWEIEHRSQMGIVVATPIKSGPHLFFTSQYGGARMLMLEGGKPGAKVLWQGPGEQDQEFTHDTENTLNSVISTPVMDGAYVYGIDNDGQLRCLDIETGKLMWKTDALLKEHAMYGTAFFVRNGDRFFITNDKGELVIAKLSPKGFEEISRATLIEPTHPYVRRRQLANVLWSHPAYANKHIVIRNDKEIIRLSLAATP